MIERMKNEIVTAILYMEKQSIGRRICNCIQTNSGEYYLPFENLYESNAQAFRCAILELRDDGYSSCNTDEFSYFAKERILVHLWRLSVYFDIECAEIEQRLKEIFRISLSMCGSDDYQLAESGRRLFDAGEEFLRTLVNNDPSHQSQRFYKDVPVLLPIFQNLISLKEVDCIVSAGFYQTCAQLRLVKPLPTYIKNALKAAYIINQLYGTVMWEYYLENRAHVKIQKDILSLKKVGFVKIPEFLEKISQTINTTDFSSKEKRSRFCEKLCLKYAVQIKACMDEEKNIIDEYLISNKPSE